MNLYARPEPESASMHPRGIRLWDEVQWFTERYIVDNHIPWEKYARRKENSSIAFIVGTTVLNERTRLSDLFEKRGQRKTFKNAFHFSSRICEATENGYIVRGQLFLDKVDEALLSVFSRASLNSIGDFASKLGLTKSIEEVEPEVERLLALVRTELLNMLRFPRSMCSGQLLEDSIRGEAAKCFANYRNSVDVARRCLALHLVRDTNRRGNARSLFEKKGSANAFSDAGLIKDALFFNAGILSEDEGVSRMAGFCGIEVRRDLPNK